MSTTRLNIVAALAALALAVTGAALGCGGHHLGPDTGRAYDEALAGQRASQPKDAPGLDADDARRVMHVHRNGGQGKGDGASAAPTPAPISGALMSSDGALGGAWPGADGNITLEAK